MTGIQIRGDMAIGQMTDKEKSELVFKAVESLKEAIRSTTNGYLKTGALLSMIFDNKLYRNLSSDVKTWEQFVAHTCPFKVAFSDHLRRVYATYKDSIGNRIIPFNRLLEALPVVTADNIESILEDAESLPRAGWNNQIRSAKKLVTTDECEHLEVDMYSKCKKCNAWLKL